ncbi:hypothetical protein [Pseudomonas putida]|uniref:hypothetical protein n=1 Tax=Pseudomonas putida TaxID=303 RepID=UPI002363C60B|nr:hypothetical protein [Pseudomonas putida]MDD2005078.1 hypothetical protein [Pseudomonas putida]
MTLITSVTAETADICSIYLVGGYSGRRDQGTRSYTPPLHIFRTGYKERLAKVCGAAEKFEPTALRALRRLIESELRRAKWFRFDGKEYNFEIQSFDPPTIGFLMREVMAQVNPL